MLFEQILSLIPCAVFWKDVHGAFKGCNKHFLDFAGLKNKEQIIDKTDKELPWATRWEEYYQDDQYVITTGKTISRQEKVTTPYKEIIAHTIKTQWTKENKVAGVLGVIYDVTELVEAKDKAEAANRAKTEFLENMRHDIRTPLVGITGFASIIRDEITDPRIKEYADNLIASGQALLELLNEILDVVKINSGEVPLLKKKFNLKERLTQVIKLNQAKALHKQIDLSLDYDAKIPPYLIGDSARVHRIVLELINNALNFIEKGTVKLIAQLAKTTEEGVVVKLIVEDTGVGMTPEQQQQIFVQFKRLTPSYEGIYKGAGLGLAIVKKFLEEMSGEIYVESKPNVGSTFTCLIPFSKPLLDDAFGCEKPEEVALKEEITTVEMRPVEPTKENKQKNAVMAQMAHRVLVVEDQAIASIVIKGTLTKLNCQVDIAPNGKTGVELAQTNHYDLILMDIGLPDIDGYEATERIRLYELTKGMHVPIIALTAHIDEENKQRCLEVGMNAVLSKPLARQEAEDILNAFIPYRKDLQQKTATPAIQEKLAKTAKIQGKIIDREAAKKLLVEDENLVLDMLPLLQTDLEEELEKLESAHQKGDWPTVAVIAHKIKGGCDYCGTLRLKEACAQVESAIKHKQTSYYVSLYQQLLAEMQLVQDAIKANDY